MIGSSLDYVRSELEKTIESAEAVVASGRARSFDEYREMTGFIRGLNRALDLTKPREEKNESA